MNGTGEGVGGAEHAEGVVRERFHRGLEGVPTRFAPVEEAMRRGRGIRTRRRLTAGGSLVLAAAVVVGAVTASPRTPAKKVPPVKHSVVHKLSQTPGSAAAGQIAAGVIDGVPWSVSLVDTAVGGCWFSAFSGSQTRDLGDSCDLGPAALLTPVDLAVQSYDGFVFYAVGAVADGVTSVDVQFGDDETVRVTPAALNGAHYVALAKPAGLAVVRMTAHSANGDQFTIPYSGSGDDLGIGTWYRAGQTVPSARTTRSFPVPSQGSRMPPVTVALGPWGRCFVFAGDLSGVSPTCEPDTVPTPQDHLHMTAVQPGGVPATLIFGEVDPVVARVVFPLDSGGSLDARVMTVDGHAYICVLTPGGVQKWTNYDAAGHVVPAF